MPGKNFIAQFLIKVHEDIAAKDDIKCLVERQGLCQVEAFKINHFFYVRCDAEIIFAVLFQLAQQECLVILRGAFNLVAVIEPFIGAREHSAVNIRADYLDSV